MTKSQIKFVVESYAKYFGRAADADTIKAYGEKDNGKAEKASVILKNIIADADAEKAELSTSDFVNNAFQNLFGRNATTKEMNKYSKVVEKGKNLPINSIVKSAAKVDKDVNKNKLEVAAKYAELGGKDDLDLSKISKGNLIKDIKTVTTLADLKAKVDALADNSGIPSSFDGKTFVLTESVNTFVGTNKDDQFIADNSVTGKVNGSAADTLDGGKGVDTFKVYDDASTPATSTTIKAGLLPTLKNIENVVIYDNASTAAGVINLKKWDSVETLFLVRDTSTGGYDLGKKVTTVNLEDSAATKTLNFDAALTAATLGVNNVTAGTGVTVTGAALKTLTVNASGKESTISNITNAAIETLNITGKANLTLTSVAGLGTVKTVDGSKAEGNLTLTNTTSMTSIKTGSGNDKVTLNAAVATGETINLGAGNDKLVMNTGSVAASTTTVIDGGAGIDSLDAALVNATNAGVFANFETLSLNTTAANLDLALVSKSTFTTIAIDGANTSTVRNVSTSQSLTVNATGTSTTLLFKDVAGTADAYTINFDKEKTGTIDAKTVVIDKIETVTVNSLGKTSAAADTNKIDLRDADAKSLVITGDKALDVKFGAAFGDSTANATNGLGVATIDASAATGAVTIVTTNVTAASNGLTIKGGTADDNITIAQKATVEAGAGDDTITTSLTGGTLTGGAGKDTFDISASVLSGIIGTVPAELTEATGVVKVTITDLTAGDKIGFATAASFVNTKIALDNTVANLDDALALASQITVAGTITWFEYANNTYIVENLDGTTGIDAGDIVVKLNGVVDLTNSALTGTNLEIA